MAHFCADHENGPADANGDLDRSVAKSGAGFVGLYLSLLPERPEWKIIPDAQRVSQSRQVLLQQLGRRNAESTLYENMLKSVRRNFADVSLEDMTSGTDARRLFTTDEVVPGCLPAGHGKVAFSRPLIRQPARAGRKSTGC